MRFTTTLALGLVAAVASGCTIHVVEQPTTARTWGPPQQAPVVVTQPAAPRPRPVVVPATPRAVEPRRVASSTRPSAYDPVKAAPSRPKPVTQAEPRPTRPVTSKPVVSKPTPSTPVADKPKGRYPFRTTRPEPRRPELASGAENQREERARPPVLVAR